MATSTPLKVFGAAAVLGLVVGGLLIAARALRDVDESETASPLPISPSATPAPGSSPTPPGPTPEVIDGITVKPLVVGPDAAFPDDTVIYYRLGCYACDGSSETVFRMYRDSRGTITSEDVLANLRKVTGEFFAGPGWVADERFANIVATICKGPMCAAAGVGAPPGAPSEIYRSADGGLTWRRDGTIPALSVLMAWTKDGTVVSTFTGPGPSYRYFFLESGMELAPPRQGLLPMVISGMPLTWFEHNGKALSYYDASGSLLYAGRRDNERLFASDGRVFFTTWTTQNPPAPYRDNIVKVRFVTYVARTSADGTQSAIYAWDTTETFWPIQILGPGALAANVLLTQGANGKHGRLFDFEGAMVDLKSGAVAPIRELSAFTVGTGAGTQNINPFIIAVVKGAVLRVASGADCLNVRESPEVASKSLGCFVDGVLLNDLKETQMVVNITWRKVSPPRGGPIGWASAEFLR